MPNYIYTAVHKDSGAEMKGQMRAQTKNDITKHLLNDGYIVTSIAEKQFTFFLPKEENMKLTFVEKYNFTKHLAIIVNSGITLTDGIDILLRQAKSSKLHFVLAKIYDSVNAGQSLGQSLAKFPLIFEPIYVKIIELGEHSGNLGNVLKYLEDQLSKDYALRKKVTGALVYPVMIVSLVAIVGIGLITFIMPKIEQIFFMFKVELPLPTRILIFTNNFVRENGLYLLVGIIGFYFLAKWLLKTEIIRNAIDRILFKLPLIGTLVQNYNLALFSRMLSTLIKSGVSIVDGLKIIANLVNNSVYKTKLYEAHERVATGAALSEYLQNNEELFPAFLTQMLHIGERTGTIENTITHVADAYEDEMDSDLKRLSTLVEPVLLLVAGLAVAAIALSIILPIYQLPNMIKR